MQAGAPTPPPVVRRVFSLKTLGFGLLFVGLGLTVAYGVYDRYTSSNRVSIGGVVAAPLLALLGLIGVGRAFSRGCKSCNEQLVFRGYRYPATMLPYLREQLGAGGPALDVFRRAPVDTSVEASRLKIEACPRCARAAFARVDRERFGDSYKLLDAGPERRLGDHEVWIVQALAAERTADQA